MTATRLSPRQLREACDALETVDDFTVLDNLRTLLNTLADKGVGALIDVTPTGEERQDIVVTTGSIRAKYFTVGVAASVAINAEFAAAQAQKWARDTHGLVEAIAFSRGAEIVGGRWQIGIEAW